MFMADSKETETEREATERNKQPTEIISIRGGDTTKLLNARGWLARANPEYTYDLVTF
jgi:hypothetical protein